EQFRHDVAERGLSPMADVQRTRRVGRDELDHDGPPVSLIRPAEPVAGLHDRAKAVDDVVLGKTEVDEPRTGDLHRGDTGAVRVQLLDELLRDLPGCATERAGERQRHVTGEIAVLRVTWTFENDRAG